MHQLGYLILKYEYNLKLIFRSYYSFSVHHRAALVEAELYGEGIGRLGNDDDDNAAFRDDDVGLEQDRD